eukprot:9371401-Alexandrium_andersonii.AAC.1
MSASLVGSEMCIRDSCSTAWASSGTRWASCWPGAKPDRQRKPLGASVSYTHLTLPTICSV